MTISKMRYMVERAYYGRQFDVPDTAAENELMTYLMPLSDRQGGSPVQVQSKDCALVARCEDGMLFLSRTGEQGV